MRHQGRVVQWNDAKGYGFISPNGGGAKVFFHVSELATRGTRPSLGALVSYEEEAGQDGRRQAVALQFVDGRRTKAAARQGSPLTVFAMTLVVLAIGAFAYFAWVGL